MDGHSMFVKPSQPNLRFVFLGYVNKTEEKKLFCGAVICFNPFHKFVIIVCSLTFILNLPDLWFPTTGQVDHRGKYITMIAFNQ